MNRVVLAFSVLALFALKAGAQAPEEDTEEKPEANPGRPTVSTPATLTPVGYLQFESGAFGATDSPDFSTRVNVSEVVKLAVHSRLQLLLQAEPLVHTSGNVKQTKFGDAFAGFQAVIIGGQESHATLSVSYLHKIHEANLP